jgi:hypothetical protein
MLRKRDLYHQPRGRVLVRTKMGHHLMVDFQQRSADAIAKHKERKE